MKPSALRVAGVEGREGRVYLALTDDAGSDLEVPLEIANAAHLSSLVNAGIEEALQQPHSDGGEFLLPLAGLATGSDDANVTLRVYIAPHVFADYGAPRGTPAAEAVHALRQVLEAAGATRPVSADRQRD